jgi:hypothetical protein
LGYCLDRKHVYKDVVVGATCDHCEKELEPVFLDGTADNEYWIGKMAKDALDVRLIGGYGQYYDSLYGAVEILLCKECADKLIELFPCMGKEIEIAEGAR